MRDLERVVAGSLVVALLGAVYAGASDALVIALAIFTAAALWDVTARNRRDRRDEDLKAITESLKPPRVDP